jgi:hypothetical protein
MGLDRSISTAAGSLSGLLLKLLSARFQWQTPAVNDAPVANSKAE